MHEFKARLKNGLSLGRLTIRMFQILRRSRDFLNSNTHEVTVVRAYPQGYQKGLVDTHFRPEAYLLSKQRKIEVDTEKAILISLSRHPRWKGAGGPY